MEESPEYKTSLFSFLRAFGARWFIAMSGPLTVPFAIAALLFESKFHKALFGLLAVVCAVFATYWLWRLEREAKRAKQFELEAERARNAAAIIRTSIECVVIEHGHHIMVDSYCTLFLNVVVWNDSASGATIRDFRCALISSDQEFTGTSLPVTGHGIHREVLEHQPWEPKRGTMFEEFKALSTDNHAVLTNLELREGWLCFQFPGLPFLLTDRVILEEWKVRLAVIDNKGTTHGGEACRMTQCEGTLGRKRFIVQTSD